MNVQRLRRRLSTGIIRVIPAALYCAWAVAAAGADAGHNSMEGFDPSVPAARMKVVERTIAPPPKPIFDVRKYGAVGDGKTYDTKALQKAIDACAGSGGSVVLSKGAFLTAHLTLKGNMTLYIEHNAVLLGGTRPHDYPVNTLPPKEARGTIARAVCRSLLFANKADKLILDGGGVIDGQGKFVKMSGKEPDRPSLLRIFYSNDIAVRNLTFRNARMWTQLYDHCNKLTIENLTVFCPPVCANLDGMDICDSSDVLIRNCHVESEDDGICLKSHGEEGLKNITIQNNTIHCYRANAIKIGTASRGPIENIRILNNTVKFAKFGGVCIESVDGSSMRNVLVRGLDLYRTAQPFFIRLGQRTSGDPGSITDILIENVRVLSTHSQTAPSCTITGIAAARIGTIRLKNLYMEMPGGQSSAKSTPREHDRDYPQSNMFGDTPAYGFYVRHAENVVFENVSIGYLKKDARPWLASTDANVKTVQCKDLKAVNPIKFSR